MKKTTKPIAIYLAVFLLIGLLASGLFSTIVATIAMSWGEVITGKHKKEVGDTLVYKVSVEVSTGVKKYKETKEVRAEIIGHKSRGGSVYRVYETFYENGDTFKFDNSKGDHLEVFVENAQFLYDGSGFTYAKIKYADGKVKEVTSYSPAGEAESVILVKELELVDSAEKYGFRLISYKVELVEVIK